MDGSGLLRAGRLLVLVGGIIGIVVGSALALLSLSVGAAFDLRGGLLLLYPVMAGMAVLGGLLCIVAFLRLGAGHVRQGAMLSMVAAFLPPVQGIVLVGAVLVWVSPENQDA